MSDDPMVILDRLLAAMGLPIGEVFDVADGSPPFTITLDLPALAAGSPVHGDGRLIVSDGGDDPGRTLRRAAAVHPRIVDALDALRPHLLAHLARSPLKLTLNVGDSGADAMLSFDRPVGDARPLLPDLYLLRTKAPDRVPRWRDFKADFLRRRPVLFWRGSTTGGQATTLDELLDNPRVRACLAIARLPEGAADCRIAHIVQAADIDIARAMDEFRRRRIWGEWVDEAAFGMHRMTIDLPGNSAAWGTCRKYLAGCLVLRPPQGYELIYSHRLAPWEHYVPVRADLADLEERLAWAADHAGEAAAIAWRGQALLARVTEELPQNAREIIRTQAVTKATA